MDNPIKYPDSKLREVEVSPEAKELAADLWHEARVERVYAIIQLALDGYLDKRCDRSRARVAVPADPVVHQPAAL